MTYPDPPSAVALAETGRRTPVDPPRIAPHPKTVFGIVVLLLFSAGWATNHFATMLAVLRDQENFSALVVNGAYGVYAVGLLPCLLFGGMLADRLGAKPVVLTGAVAAAVGNLGLLLWQTTTGLFVGRFVLGLGVGLAISAGTAWAARLRGAHGAVLAGIVLSAGFAVGPIASGILAFLLPGTTAISVPFLVTIALSLASVVAALLIRTGQPPTVAVSVATPSATIAHGRPRESVGRALQTSVPMALWVFSTATIAMVTLTERMSATFDAGVLFPGLAALLSFTGALVVQTLGRRFGWGPKAGVVGAVIAAAGLMLAGLGGATPPLWLYIIAVVLLGLAYGMCLREGLLDVDTYAPTHRRGTTMGLYYIFTYLGFALPVFLEWIRPVTGPTMPLIVLGCLALISAVVRLVQIRTGFLDR